MEKLKKTNHDSTWGMGNTGPASFELCDDVKLPNGKLKKIKKDCYLLYNEYIIYNTDQYKIRYIIVVKNKY